MVYELGLYRDCTYSLCVGLEKTFPDFVNNLILIRFLGTVNSTKLNK
jgi:hypothetical protein